MTENPKLRVIFGLVDTIPKEDMTIPVSKKQLEEIRRYTRELENKIKNLGEPSKSAGEPLNRGCAKCEALESKELKWKFYKRKYEWRNKEHGFYIIRNYYNEFMLHGKYTKNIGLFKNVQYAKLVAGLLVNG